MALELPYNNLRGFIPSSIGSAKNLVSLNLAGNFLQRLIPIELYTLTQLQFLDLSQNSLEGSISANIMQLTSLRALSLQNNLLSGTLPSSLGSLTGLNMVLLHQNSFTGTVPASFASLVNVTTWDLSLNRFDRETSLPTPLCPQCARSWIRSDIRNCSSGVTGYLMTCSSAKAVSLRRDTRIFGNGSLTLPVSVSQAISNMPDLCAYRFA
jgi:hypothetical protein